MPWMIPASWSIGRRTVLAAGFILIALGIGGLILSHWFAVGRNATANSWWVGTLQALGVGFAVGGVVDVLVISGLDAVNRAEEEKRKDLNMRAKQILSVGPAEIRGEVPLPTWSPLQKQEMIDLLTRAKAGHRNLLDKDLEAQLRAVIIS